MSSGFKDIIAEDFQLAADVALVRNRLPLDTLSKLECSAARLSRAITKAHTQCGCIDLCGTTDTLCAKCRGAVETELGDLLFYAAGLCNAFGLSIYDVMLKEKQALSLLGSFNLK